MRPVSLQVTVGDLSYNLPIPNRLFLDFNFSPFQPSPHNKQSIISYGRLRN